MDGKPQSGIVDGATTCVLYICAVGDRNDKTALRLVVIESARGILIIPFRSFQYMLQVRWANENESTVKGSLERASGKNFLNIHLEGSAIGENSTLRWIGKTFPM